MGKKLPEIKKRDDGYYEIKLTIGNGKRRSVYGKTETEVRRKAKQLREEAARFDISTFPE